MNLMETMTVTQSGRKRLANLLQTPGSKPLWILFQTADHKSLFFSARSDVQWRMLARWINKASQRLLGPSCPEAAVVEDAKEKLQVMNMAVALYRKWQQRKELVKAQGLCQTIAHCRCNFPQNPSPT